MLPQAHPTISCSIYKSEIDVIHCFCSFWFSLSFSFILEEVPELGDAPTLWSKLDAKGLRLPPLRSRLDNELLILLRVLVMPLVWRRDSTGLSRVRSSKMGILSRACTTQDAQSGMLLSCAYLSLVIERSANTSRAPNIAPARTVLQLARELKLLYTYSKGERSI